MPADDPWIMTVRKFDEIDEAEVRRALGLLVDPSRCVQIQALPSGRWRHVPGRDLDGLVGAVRELSDEKGCYFSLNPFAGPLDHATKSVEVTARRWFLVDPDAVKPGEKGKDCSTSDREKDLARQTAEAIRDFLRERRWPDPIFVDSGNNWQLLYRVDLPNDKMSQQWLSRALKRLAERFDSDAVKVDRSVHDARRICKIPGTWVRKGDNTPERPWRIARLISVPARSPLEMEVVPLERLKELADLPKGDPAPTPDRHPVTTPELWRIDVGGDDRRAYARSGLEREVGIVATAVNPGRNKKLYDAALKLGSLVAAGLLDRNEVLDQLGRAAQVCGLGQDGDPKEVERAIRNGFNFGLQNPREIPGGNRNGTSGGRDRGDGMPGPATSPESPLVIQASRVVPRQVSWLWRDRVPRGFITIFAGRTGLGKSFVTCDITARVTRGDSWPDGDGECVEAGNVLLISEDPFEYVLTPRLIEMEADLNRVFYMSWEAMAHYQLDDTDMLGRAAALAGEPSLVVIDPPTNFLGSRDEHKNVEVRQTLMRLVSWLKGRERPVACILITHVNKGGGKGIEALNRVIGSVAWTTTARIAHTFSPDPSNPARCLFVPMKNNLGPLAKGLAYRIVQTETFARVEWLGEVDTTADEAMDRDTPPGRGNRGERAAEWLRDRFAERNEWPSEELFALAEQSGISRNAMFEAKKTLKLPAARQVGLPGGGHAWVWRGPGELAEINGAVPY